MASWCGVSTVLKRHTFGLAKVRARLARLDADESGNVAVFTAVTMVVLLLAIGAAVDTGRWLHARDQTAAAIDAALLAGGRALQTNSRDPDLAIATAQKFFDQNVASRLPVKDETVVFDVIDNGKAITAEGTAFLETPFLRLASIERLPIRHSSKAELAVGGSGGENLEISMMLDVTGSMAGQKLRDLKDAAKDLVDIVVWDDQSEFTSKVALVPFSEDIRLPTTTALNLARGSGLEQSKAVTTGSGWWSYSTTYYLSDCVVERIGSRKYTDDEPGSNKYVMAHYTESYTTSGGNWWGGGTKKGVCSIPDESAILPLSSDTEVLKSKIDALSAKGGTAGHLGTAWAWYTLSPNWGSLWSMESRPQAYGSENLRKIAILMTDGEYNTQYDDEGVSAGTSQAANGSSTSQARSLCSAMKAKGITVYTVGFELSSRYSEAYQTLYQCASDPEKFYSADDGEQLKQAFRDIALKLSSLFLSR